MPACTKTCKRSYEKEYVSNIYFMAKLAISVAIVTGLHCKYVDSKYYDILLCLAMSS